MASTQLRASLFHGFSDHSRLAILEQLIDGPRQVSDIVGATGPGPAQRLGASSTASSNLCPVRLGAR
jgi:hypothetical protein